MNNKLLTYKEEPKPRLNKYHIIKIIIPIVSIIILISIIAFYCFIYNSPSNKLKRYLKDNLYECNNKICHKQVRDYIYEINYKTGDATIKNDNMSFKIGTTSSNLRIKDKNLTCNYSSDYYKQTGVIDENFKIEKECREYVDELNELIDNYRKILSNAEVDVKDLSN